MKTKKDKKSFSKKAGNLALIGLGLYLFKTLGDKLVKTSNNNE
tara:strand:- start:177 stop:305 length:129 start_codon:yes stop_codon:yes gene_type:complete